MHTRFAGAAGRFALAIAAGALALSLSLPALAVDTGGGGGTPAASSSSSSSSSMAAPSAMTAHPSKPMMAPKMHMLDLNDARALIAKSDWTGAIKMLRVIVVQQPKNADALNLLGFSLRNKGEMKEAEAWYLKALRLKPNHLGANEYLGELYVMTGQMPKAQAELKTLAKICGNTTCEEYQDLAKAIAAKA